MTSGSQNRISAQILAHLASKFPNLKTLKLGEAFGCDEEKVILPNHFEQLESLSVGNIYLSAKAFFGLVTELIIKYQKITNNFSKKRYFSMSLSH